MPCPSCGGGLIPRVLECNTCGTRVETRSSNEFAHLDDETLHMLRIFVRCEGRIRDMEAALGVSYPTVKARVAKLREQLNPAIDIDQESPTADAPAASRNTPREVLDALDRGEMDYETALAELKAIRNR
jgi:hypothetical protein